MFLFLKKKTDDEEQPPGEKRVSASTAQHLPFHEFIPYHSHYNPYTLLTKNGEVMQIIKITVNNQGLNYESGEGNVNSVREGVRKAITETIKSDKYAVWIHTQRKRKPISYSGRYDNELASYTHNLWQSKHRWKYEYYNETYITVLHEGQTCVMWDKENLKKIVFPAANRGYRNEYLDNSAAELTKVVTTMLHKIQKNYNAQRLSIVERISDQYSSLPPVFFSEPMEFLGELLNLQKESFPVRETDLCKQMVTHNLTFGFNAFESRSITGVKRFGTVLTLKQYHEVTPETADFLLQYPVELVISQNFRFIPHKQALKQYKEQKVLYEISEDTYSSQVTGLDDMLASNQRKPTDFGEQQTSIMVLVDEYKHLNSAVVKVQEAFAQMGLIAVREDIKLEECFWSQLPGNFEFIRRPTPINTPKIGGFCRLNLFPNGEGRNTHWKEPVTVIPTTVNSPYFFNFHSQDNGHTVIYDFNSFHDATGHILLNFLLTSALKFNGRLYVFDRYQSSQLWFHKLKGHYHSFPLNNKRKDDSNTLRLNPFSLENTPRNQSFLLAWCCALIESQFTPSEEQKETIRSAVSQLYAGDPATRNFDNFASALRIDPRLSNAFAPFHGEGKLAGLFDAPSETLDLRAALHAFNMDPIVKRSECTVAVFAYLMHRIIETIDGTPTIIVLDEAWDLLENSFFAPRLESLMEMLKQNNAMIIFMTRTPEAVADKYTFPIIMQNSATKIFVPDDIQLPYASLLPGLSAYDTKILTKMNRQRGDFLIKQRDETIGLSVDLAGMEDVKSIFANDIKTLIAAGGKFASIPKFD